ncbi:MAG TPA: hypothetical protein VJW51_13530 [Candidatus Acidoferrales bacterium]|nr:hypothetical protein [Candidatus Acidoferrales bacterium]
MNAHRVPVMRKIPLALAALAIASGFSAARAQAPAAAREPAQEQRYAVEYYYKVSWGHADEWLRLFKKNHVPVLKALQAQGRIVELEMERPRYHMPEDARWDFRVTITWKNFAASQDPGTEQALVRKLFPDQETFQREEQRRFEILLAHWDLPIVDVNTEP